MSRLKNLNEELEKFLKLNKISEEQVEANNLTFIKTVATTDVPDEQKWKGSAINLYESPQGYVFIIDDKVSDYIGGAAKNLYSGIPNAFNNFLHNSIIMNGWQDIYYDWNITDPEFKKGMEKASDIEGEHSGDYCEDWDYSVREKKQSPWEKWQIDDDGEDAPYLRINYIGLDDDRLSYVHAIPQHNDPNDLELWYYDDNGDEYNDAAEEAPAIPNSIMNKFVKLYNKWLQLHPEE